MKDFKKFLKVNIFERISYKFTLKSLKIILKIEEE